MVELRECNEQLSDLRLRLSDATSTIVSLQLELEKNTQDNKQKLESMLVLVFCTYLCIWAQLVSN